MAWMINAVYALFLTTVTGSILYLFWNKIGKVLDQMGYLNVLYYLLQVNSIFFCVPFVFLILSYLDNAFGSFGGTLFLQTMKIQLLCYALFVVWLVGFLVSFIRHVVEAIKAYKKFHTGNECRPIEYHCFQIVCEKLRINAKKIKLYRTYNTNSPCIMGILKPRVLLPEKEYTERELEIVFLHELTHYQQRDLWVKAVTMFVGCVQWFNPIVKYYRESVEEWSEYACDLNASKKAPQIHT